MKLFNKTIEKCLFKVLYLSYLLVGGLIFATFVFYAENFASDMNDYGNSKFTSITMSFWYVWIKHNKQFKSFFNINFNFFPLKGG